MVIVPTRALAVPFVLTSYATVPLPLPEAPIVTEIQDALLTAVQAHPVPLETDTLLNVEPIAGTVAVVADRLYEQSVGLSAEPADSAARAITGTVPSSTASS